ncbi:MAG: YihY/virulence factor BrkB family protein [Lachnospiraceae bacterium]|nr:YihY/virulence factor BrkB family protein [Lachnospiraceae bacterium]
MTRKLYWIARDFAKDMSQKNISAFAASTAFFIFLSIVPMLILICTIIPYTPLTENMILAFSSNMLPDVFDPYMEGIIRDVYGSSAGVLTISAIATLWAAGRGMLALIRGLNRVNEVEENRNYFQLRIMSSFYTLILLLSLSVTLILGVFGRAILRLVERDFPLMGDFVGWMMPLRFVVSWCILLLVFMLIYTYIPNQKKRFIAQFPGAVFSAVVWSVFSFAFSIYVDRFNGYSTYGSLATIVIMMFWLYACLYIVLIGAHINRYFAPIYRFLFHARLKRRNTFEKM